MKFKILSSVVLFLLLISQFNAQTVVGFWEVTSVKVGVRSMTPVAKWFKINSDGTVASGNGWTQNLEGTWSFKENKFKSESKNGVKDEFGAFTVSFSDSVMIWKRAEEGVNVTVSLIPIEVLPMAPIDQIKGLWRLVKVKKGEVELSNYDPNQKQFLHVRPDMRYRVRNPDESFSRGIWHMDGHRPIFTLINRDKESKDQVFTILFNGNELTLTETTDENRVFIYERINAFPD